METAATQGAITLYCQQALVMQGKRKDWLGKMGKFGLNTFQPRRIMTKRMMDTVPCLRGTDGNVPGCCSNKAGLWKDGFFFLFSHANLSPASALCRCGRRAVTFTLPLTSWFGDGQLCRRAFGVREPEQRGGKDPLEQLA